MTYIPKEIYSLNTQCKLMVIERYEKTNGVSKPIYAEAKISPLFYCNFKTYGGTETTVNDRYVIKDTAHITMRYRPDVKSGCHIVRMSDGAVYEIKNEPENIEQRNQYLKFIVERVKGKS